MEFLCDCCTAEGREVEVFALEQWGERLLPSWPLVAVPGAAGEELRQDYAAAGEKLVLFSARPGYAHRAHLICERPRKGWCCLYGGIASRITWRPTARGERADPGRRGHAPGGISADGQALPPGIGQARCGGPGPKSSPPFRMWQAPQLRQCWRKSPLAFMMKVAAPTKKQLSKVLT